MLAIFKKVFIYGLFLTSSLSAHVSIPDSWTAELVMTRATISNYFHGVFRQQGYGSYAGYHLIDFLAYARSSKNSLSFSLKILDLFHMRMKEALWTNPYLVDTVLRAMIAYVHPVFVQAQRQRSDGLKRSIYDILLHRFDELKQDPDLVIDELVVDLITQIEGSDSVRLRMTVVRLIENMLDRLIWSLSEQADAWQITRVIADDLYALYEIGLIPDAITLNHCLWSLTYRFAYALEASGDLFSLMTYQRIKSDIGSSNSILFTFTDVVQQQGSMKTRAEWLTDIVFAGEVRARRIAEGAWTAEMPIVGIA